MSENNRGSHYFKLIRGRTSVGSDVLPPLHVHPQLHVLESIESTNLLAVLELAFLTQQYQNPHVAKPWAGIGQIANAELET